MLGQHDGLYPALLVPATDPDNSPAYIAMANQLNNPAGNKVHVLFPDFPKQSQVETWDANSGDYFGEWVGTGRVPRLEQHSGFKSGSGCGGSRWRHYPRREIAGGRRAARPTGERFHDDVGQILSPRLNNTARRDVGYIGFSCGGRRPDSAVFRTNNGPRRQRIALAVAGVHRLLSLQVGECFFLISGTSGTRTWTENLPACEPAVTLVRPTDGNTFVGPASIALSATATADAGISKVEFFQGATSLWIRNGRAEVLAR